MSPVTVLAVFGILGVFLVFLGILDTADRRTQVRQEKLRTILLDHWNAEAEFAEAMGELEDAMTIRSHFELADHLAWEMATDRRFRREVLAGLEGTEND